MRSRPHYSWHFPQCREVGDRIGRLAPQMQRFVGTADRTEVAPGACALGRRRRQKAQLDRAVDDVLTNFAGGRLIFNLGHGIQPETPIPHVEQMIRRVRGNGARP